MIKKTIGGAIACVALLASAPAFATTAVFSFTSASNSALSGAAGNSSVYTVNGITVTATAWSTAGYATPVTSDLPQSSYLGKYTAGLGVTDSGDGSGSNNQHTIDDVGRYDFIQLVFSTPVQLTAAVLQGFSVNSDGHTDTDAWVSYGNTAFVNPVVVNAATQALWTAYLNAGANVASGTSFGTITGTHAGTVWLIGAEHTTSDRDDGFKLSGVTVNSTTPEPGTWLMMSLGFGIIGFSLRRRTGNAIAGTASLHQAA